MVKTKDFSQKLTEEIISLHLEGRGYKNSQKCNIQRDTIESIRPVKTCGRAAELRCRGRTTKMECPRETFPSLDLNSIENLWCDLKKAVAVRKPSNITELGAFVKNVQRFQ